MAATAKRLSSPPGSTPNVFRWQDLLRTESGVFSSSPLRTSSSGGVSKSESELLVGKVKKVVFLGNSESGKTTIYTQIQRLERGGSALHLGTAESVRLWIAHYLRLELPEQFAKSLGSHDGDDPTEWREEMADTIRKAVSSCNGTAEYKRQTGRSIGGLLHDLDRILAPDYTPTDRDLLLSIAPTSSIAHATLRKTNMLYHLVDVGGRLQQRRKWTQCMVDASAIVICASLADFERVLRWRTGDEKVLICLQDSLLIAEELATRMMRHVPIFVVLTKSDLLPQKLAAGGPTFKSIFPDYTGPDDSAPHVVDYIKSLFVKAMRGAEVRFHICNSLDPNDVGRLWIDVCGSLTKKLDP